MSLHITYLLSFVSNFENFMLKNKINPVQIAAKIMKEERSTKSQVAPFSETRCNCDTSYLLVHKVFADETADAGLLTFHLEATKTLTHSLVSSRLDYCNSLLYGVNDGLLKKRQIVHNGAARVVTEARKLCHISLMLCVLHWLHFRHRIK